MDIDHSDVLGDYKGFPVKTTKIVVNKLGDGLSKAVDVEPLVVEVGDVAYLVSRVVTTKHRYDFVKDESGKVESACLVQIFEATGATFADAKLAQAAVNKMMDKIAKEEALRKEQLSLEFEYEEDDNITHLANAKKARNAHKDVADKVDEVFKGKK